MKSFSEKAEDWLKELVCEKKKLPHMEREVRLPNCLQFCAELCGKKCRDRCTKVMYVYMMLMLDKCCIHWLGS